MNKNRTTAGTADIKGPTAGSSSNTGSTSRRTDRTCSRSGNGPGALREKPKRMTAIACGKKTVFDRALPDALQ